MSFPPPPSLPPSPRWCSVMGSLHLFLSAYIFLKQIWKKSVVTCNHSAVVSPERFCWSFIGFQNADFVNSWVQKLLSGVVVSRSAGYLRAVRTIVTEAVGTLGIKKASKMFFVRPPPPKVSHGLLRRISILEHDTIKGRLELIACE